MSDQRSPYFQRCRDVVLFPAAKTDVQKTLTFATRKKKTSFRRSSSSGLVAVDGTHCIWSVLPLYEKQTHFKYAISFLEAIYCSADSGILHVTEGTIMTITFTTVFYGNTAPLAYWRSRGKYLETNQTVVPTSTENKYMLQ